MKGSVARWGNSLAIRLPKGIAEDAKLEDGGEIELNVEDGRVIITPQRRRYSIKRLVAGITPDNLHQEMEWDTPLGNEVW